MPICHRYDQVLSTDRRYPQARSSSHSMESCEGFAPWGMDGSRQFEHILGGGAVQINSVTDRANEGMWGQNRVVNQANDGLAPIQVSGPVTSQKSA